MRTARKGKRWEEQMSKDRGQTQKGRDKKTEGDEKKLNEE